MSSDMLFKTIKVLSGAGVTGLLTEVAIDSIKKSREKVDAEEASIEDLQEEVSRQEYINKISSVQAKALQELAIARRIDTALEVEIEEFYENQGGGGFGFNFGSENQNAGVNGTGSKITKRIYRFKGFRDTDEDGYEETNEQEIED